MTHPADFRSLCAELVDGWRQIGEDAGYERFRAALDRARALLSAPQQGPTIDDISELCDEFNFPLGEDDAGSTLCQAIRLWEMANALLTRYGAQAVPVAVAIPADQWHDDDGPCLWWAFPINEPPYAGSPLDDDWPGYHTHFTRIVCPELPLPEAQP